MLSVTNKPLMPSVIMLNVVVLSVVAPCGKVIQMVIGNNFYSFTDRKNIKKLVENLVKDGKFCRKTVKMVLKL
jgi:hypothetical protein